VAVGLAVAHRVAAHVGGREVDPAGDHCAADHCRRAVEPGTVAQDSQHEKTGEQHEGHGAQRRAAYHGRDNAGGLAQVDGWRAGIAGDGGSIRRYRDRGVGAEVTDDVENEPATMVTTTKNAATPTMSTPATVAMALTGPLAPTDRRIRLGRVPPGASWLPRTARHYIARSI